jgi:hypothetical protein
MYRRVMRSATKGWKIDRVWKHAHDRDPPCRYMICVSKDGDVRVHSVWAIDELDAVKQFLKDK